jgi:hypothetical protein
VLTALVYGSTPRFGGAIPSLSERPSRNGNPSHGLRGLIHSTSLTIFDIRPVLLGGSADAFDHVRDLHSASTRQQPWDPCASMNAQR